MRQNHLCIRVLFNLASMIFFIFLMQGCICKNCVSAVSKQGSDGQINQRYTVHDPNTTGSGSPGTIGTESPVPIAAYSSHGTGNTIKALSGENIVISQQANADGNFLFPKTMFKKEEPAEGVSYLNENSYIDIYKIIPAKAPIENGCPLGIRSISSQIMAGPNMSFKSSKEGEDVYGSNDHKHQPGAGFQLGWGLNVGFNDKFSVSPSLLLKQNNASEKIKYSYTEPGSTGGGETKDKYSYTSLSVPIVANYQVGKQVQVFAGPEVNYLLKASVKSKGSNGRDSKDNISKNSAKVGVGVQAGVKYKIPSGNGNSPFGVQLLYEHRLSRLNKKNPDGYGSYSSPAWNMKGFQLGVTCSICELMKGRN